MTVKRYAHDTGCCTVTVGWQCASDSLSVSLNAVDVNRAFAVDGSDRRVLARGTYRTPRGIAVDGDRGAWFARRCPRGQRHRHPRRPQPARPKRSRPAAPRSGHARLRARRPDHRAPTLRAPLHRLATADRFVRGTRPFSLGRGTHPLRLRVVLGAAPPVSTAAVRQRSPVAVDDHQRASLSALRLHIDDEPSPESHKCPRLYRN